MASTSWYPQIAQHHRLHQDPLDEPEQQMPVTTSSQRFCRLCLSKEQQLKPLFPPDGAPDEALLRRILNCLTISISFEEDYDTFICRICIQEVTKFFLYKEQCLANDSILRGRRKPAKVPFYGDGEEENSTDYNGFVEMTESEEGEPIDSDEFDIREEEDPPEASGDIFGGRKGFDNGLEMDLGMLKPLPKQRARRENVQDYYHGGFRYTCATSRANGKVHWRCMYKSKLKCRAAILVAPNGTVSRGPHRHNHYPDNKALPYQAEATILDVHTGQQVTYKMVTSNRSRINPTQIVCDGYKYRYARTTQKQTTYWRCMKHNGKENCKAVLSFRLDFSSCSSNGHKHNHPAQYDMRLPLPNFQSDEPDCPQEEEEEDAQLVTRMKENGTDSKSPNQKSKWNVMIHKGYEFGFPRIERKNTKWACYKKSLFNCPANVYTNWSGKVIRESDWAHNHGAKDDYDKDALIEGYMQDANTKEQMYYKLIPGKRGQRFIVFKGYRYSSDRLISDGRIAWKCTKCKVFIVVGGRFTHIEERGGEHEHPVSDENDATVDMAYQTEDQQLTDPEQSQDGQEEVEEFSVKNERIDDDSNSMQQYEEDNNDEDNVNSDDDEEQMIIPDIHMEGSMN